MMLVPDVLVRPFSAAGTGKTAIIIAVVVAVIVVAVIIAAIIIAKKRRSKKPKGERALQVI